MAPSALDKEAAHAALITVSDVPTGFSEVPASPSSSSSDQFEKIPECATFVETFTSTDAQRTAKAKVEFKDPSKNQIEESIEVYADADTAERVSAVADDPTFATCMQAAFTFGLDTSLPAGTTAGTVTVTPATDLDSASVLGVDTAQGLLIEVPITASGKTVTVRTGLVVLTLGRMTSSISVQTTGSLDVSTTITAAAAKLSAADLA